MCESFADASKLARIVADFLLSLVVSTTPSV